MTRPIYRAELPVRRGRFLPRRFGLASVLSLPRHGDSGEDRWAAADGAWALCDGASEGYDGALWAAVLARALASHEDPREATFLARRRYHAIRGGFYSVQPNPAPGGAYTVHDKPSTAPPPASPCVPAPAWLAEASAARGSWATALSVRVSGSGGFVRAYARGDTVLFVRDGLQTVASFPIDDPAAFGASPDLVADRSAPAGESPADPAADPGAFRAATIPIGALRRPVLCLATDALAARLLRVAGSERAELWDFLDRADARELELWARAETARGALREDDLTLVEVRP